MVDVVDSIVAELEVRLGNYVSNFNKAADAHERFTKTRPDKVGQFTTAEVEKYANRHKAAGDVQIQTNDRVARSAKKRSADEVSAADAVKKAARDSEAAQKQAARAAEAAVRASARAWVQTEKQAAREIEQAQRRYYAQGPKVFEAKAREFSAVDRQKDIIAAQASAAALVKAEREKQAAAKVTAREEAATAREVERRAVVEREASAAIAAAADREAAARARLASVAERAAGRRAGQIAPAVGGSIGATVPREATGQRGVPIVALAGASEAVAAEQEINHLLADQAVLQSRVGTATGKTKDKIREQLTEMRLEAQLRKAGLNDQAILLRLEERRVAIARQQAISGRGRGRSSTGNDDSQTLLEKLVETLNGNKSGGDNAGALAGLASVVGVGVGIAVIQSAIDYGKALGDLSDQLGITVVDLQAYQKLARDTGVEVSTLSSAFGQFASNLGKAQQGNAEQAKVFKALGIEIKDFKTAGEALPTVIDRISKLKDPLQRAGIEARFFGEEGRKLDPLLSGGAASVSKLAASLQETGKALSAKEIQELDETGRKLGEVKNQLSVDFARIVSGNADAIISLANSFGVLAGKIVETIGKLQQFGAQQIRNGFISQFAGKDDKEAARQYLLGSEKGRGQLYAENNAAINRNRQAFRILPNDDRLLAAQAPGSPRKTVAQVKREQLAAANKPLLAERRDIVRGAREAVATVTAPVQAGASNQNLIRNLDTPKPPKGPKGKSAEQIAREEEGRTKQFNDQVAQANAEFLRAQEQMTASADRRAEIELQLLDTAYKARLADIDSNAKRNKLAGSSAALEDSRAAELKAAEKLARDANEKAILQDRDLDNQRALTTASGTLLDVQAGLISSQLAVARSVSERRDLELKLLENAKQQERNRLQGIINSSRLGDPAAADAKTRLGGLEADYARQAGDVRFRNRTAGEQYRDSLPKTAGQINDALDEVKVRGLQSLDDKITDSISKVFKLGGAFGDVANQIIKDLIRIGVQRAIIGPIADALFGNDPNAPASAGGGFGGIIKGIAASFNGGRASGGNVVGGGLYKVGEDGPEYLQMGMSGRVYPNGALPSVAGRSGSAVLTQHIAIDARNSVVPAEFAGAILNEANSQARAYARQAGMGAVEASPARIQRTSTLGT